MTCSARRERTACFRLRGLVLVALAVIGLNAASPAAGDFANIASTGQASPDGNGSFITFTMPALNDAGQVAFLSQLSGTVDDPNDSVALYRGATAGLALVARKGVTQVAANPIASFINNSPAINASGTVSHSATLTSPAETIALVGSGGPITVLPRVGTASPTGNNQLVSRSLPVINNTDVTSYRAIYTGTSTETGVYSRTADGTVTTRLLDGTAAPQGGTIFSLANSLPTLNESSQIALTANVDTEVFTRKAVLRLDGTTVIELARDGNMATNPSTTINNILSNAVPLNDSGQVAFSALYSAPGAVNVPGVFRVDGSGAALIAPNMLPAPDVQASATNIRIASINNAGKVAFATEFTGGGSDPLSGIYLADTGTPTLVALEDTAVLGGGKFFRRFLGESISLNNAGQVAFVAELSDSVNGPAAGRGLFLYNPSTGVTQPIIRTGDSIFGSTLVGLGFSGAAYSMTQAADVTQSPDPNFSGLNSGGQLAFNYALASGVSGIAIWTATMTPVLGDYNHNGIVDAADYTVWRDTFGRTGTGLAADGNNNNQIDTGDYTIWKSRFGMTSGAGSTESGANQTAVPEPTSLFLMALSVGVFLLAGRSRAVLSLIALRS